MKRRLAALTPLALAAACAAPAPRPAGPAAPPPPNLEVKVEEAIPTAEADGLAYARVFVGGREVGCTGTARRSQAKLWAARLPPGNYPVKVEYWLLPGVGQWERLAADWQPRERFVRVEAGKATRLRLRFSDGGRRLEVSVAREPEPTAAGAPSHS